MIGMLPIVELIRLEENSRYGTFGVIKINKQVFSVSLELPDRLNASDISSIPAQQYMCRKINSPRFGKTFEVYDVPSRSLILFHAGNLVSSSRGCIILAQYFGKLCGDRAVLNSGKTFKKFMEIMKDVDVFHLTITECY